jgi:signal transduction histidine kinase
MTMPPPKKSTPSSDYTQLLSLAVHELRTPAGVVGGYLRMLQRETETPLSERQHKMVDEAEKSCARLVAIVSELSEIAKLDAGLTTLGREPLDLLPLIQEVARGMQEQPDREVRLEVRRKDARAAMTGDPARLRAAFAAIFRAVLREQATASTVVADCRIEETGAGRSIVVVVIEDGGVQEAYKASAAPFDEKRGGLGLALPIARRVIECHGGRLWSPQTAKKRSAAIVSLPLGDELRS